MKSRVLKIWTQLQWKDRTWWQRPHAKCNWAKSPLPLACYWSELASAPREDTTRVNRCLPKSSSRKVYCYWHQKFAQPPWYGYIREVDGAERTAVAELNCPRTCPPCFSSSMFFLQWWTCEPEASEACCETEMSTPESNEASMLLVGNNSGLQGILRGLQVLAWEWGLGLTLEKTWGKVQQRLMKLRLRKWSVWP